MKKTMILAVVAMVAMLAVSQPAMAGVGGCRPGVGGCWLLTVNQAPTTPSILDSLSGAIPYHVLAAAKALLHGSKDNGGLKQSGGTTTQGVGGCRPGVGGCIL
ncbi:MAG TPA: hypothetical protein VFE84_02430 [Patescibacteria group bacterium]|nr:hypothetical protein [Patescibacteria group bacterium]